LFSISPFNPNFSIYFFYFTLILFISNFFHGFFVKKHYLFSNSSFNPNLCYIIFFNLILIILIFYPFVKVIFIFIFTIQSKIYSCPLIYFLLQFFILILWIANFYFGFFCIINFFSISSFNIWLVGDWTSWFFHL
jgi:hypothetical protein